MTRQLYGTNKYNINHYNKNNFVDNYSFLSSKSKLTELRDKTETYLNSHPLAFWTVAIVGIPIGILLAVGLITTIFGLMFLGITFLI